MTPKYSSLPTENQTTFTQTKPVDQCPTCKGLFRCRCADNRKSFQTRWNWASREWKVLAPTLKAARTEGHTIQWAVATFGAQPTPQQLTQATTSLKNRLRKLYPGVRLRWYLEAGGRADQLHVILEKVDSDAPTTPSPITEGLHLNMVLVAAQPVPQEVIREEWTQVLTQLSLYRPNASRVWVREVPRQYNEFQAVTRYIVGYCRSKYASPLFRKGRDFRMSGGTAGFFEGDKVKTYRKYARWGKAKALALQDKFSTPDFNHYLGQVDDEYKAKKSRRTAQPSVDDHLYPEVTQELREKGRRIAAAMAGPIEVEADPQPDPPQVHVPELKPLSKAWSVRERYVALLGNTSTTLITLAGWPGYGFQLSQRTGAIAGARTVTISAGKSWDTS